MSKLCVVWELRTELHKRGLSSSGDREELLKRLQSDGTKEQSELPRSPAALM